MFVFTEKENNNYFLLGSKWSIATGLGIFLSGFSGGTKLVTFIKVTNNFICSGL